MALWELKNKENVPGLYFVDSTCIACDTCTGISPLCFDLNTQHAYIAKQPANPTELQQCEDAANSCPVNAIGVYNEL